MPQPPLTSLEAELLRLQDEVELLHVAAREDERDMRELRKAAEIAESKAAAAERKAAEDARYIQQLRDEIQNISHLRFNAQTEAKSLRSAAAELSSVSEERTLLAKQAIADAEAIRALEREVNELAYARDRALERAAAAEETKEALVSEVEVLEQHAQQLRRSNAELASRVAELEEANSKYAAENLQEWFVRTGQKDAARAAELRAQQLQPQPQQQRQPIASGRYSDISREVLDNTLLTSTGMSYRPPPNLEAGDDRHDSTSGSATGSTFATVKALRQSSSADGGRSLRPTTPPLEIEAIYGEKGSGADRMYLVKYVGVHTEHWTAVENVEPCAALTRWREAKMQDRQRVSVSAA